MEFSKGQFEALIAEVTAGLRDFSDHLDEIGPTATAAVDHWYVPPAVADAIVWLANKIIEVGAELVDLFVDLLKGAVAPVHMFYDAWQWMDIRGSATAVSSALSGRHLTVDASDWSGQARDAYVGVADAQSEAAARIGSIAGNTAHHLLACAAAGAAFYATLAAVLVKLIAATVAAVAAFGSAVFSWAGAAIVLEEAGVNTLVIGTAVATLTAFLSAQATTMVNLHGEAVDVTAFPGGRWPVANTASCPDATVTDGDADWSLAH